MVQSYPVGTQRTEMMGTMTVGLAKLAFTF